MKIGRHERLECPAEFQRVLTDLFGVNHYGDPLFKIAWGQTETYDYATAHGYSQKLVGHNQPGWMMMRWRPPEIYGTPELYYQATADPATGLAMLGEYPQFGRYECLVILTHRTFDPVTHEVFVSTLPLDWDLIDKVIPALEAAERMTAAEVEEAYKAIETAEHNAKVNEIEARMRSALPTFYGPTSHAQRRNKNSLIQQKKDQIEREWKRRGLDKRVTPARGFYQGSPS